MADKTALFESSQALFCAVADYLGKVKTNQIFDLKKVPDYNSFRSAVGASTINLSSKRLDTPGVTLKDMETFLADDLSWYTSSLLIAKKLVNDITAIDKDLKLAPAGFQKLFYFRGDSDVMGNIEQLFKIANKSGYRTQAKFGNVNKWSPADIYFATEKAKKQYKKLASDRETKNNNLTFAVLNKTIADSIESGDLLPLSLKKVNKKVYVQRVNFSRDKEEELLADTICTGVKSWTPMKIKNFKYASEFTMGEYSGSRDIRVTLESGGKKGDLQFRHTPATSGDNGGKPNRSFKTVLSYKGASALGGQVVGIPLLCAVLESVDKAFAQKIQSTFDKNFKKFEKAMNKYNENGGIYKYRSKDQKIKNEFNNEVGAISARLIMNELRKEIDRFFSKPGEKRNNAVRALFAYTASRTENSSPFVIAKD